MSHPAFSPGQSPGMTGSAGGTGSALLPNITAELRGEFYPLLSTLASCESSISATYVMELFFTLVRLDAVLKAKERQLFVSTAQQLITRLLQQLQRVHHMRQLIDENERFVGELVERCAALERLCCARDGDGDCHTNDGEDADDMDVSGQALPTPQVEDDVVDGHDDGEETVCSVATTRAAGTATTRLRASPLAAHASGTIIGPELRRFSFDDSLDEIANRAWTVQQSRQQQQQQQLRGRSGGSVRSTSAETTEGGGTASSPSTSFSLRQWLRQRPSPLQWQNSGPRTASRRPHAGHTHSGAATPRVHAIIAIPEQATGKAFDEDGVRVETTSGSFAGEAAPTDVTPAVYMGVQLALQEHFRNNIRHTLTGSTLAAPRSLNELVQQQQPPPRGITTRPSSHSSERVSTTDGGVAEADMDSAPQQQSLLLNPSLVSSPEVAQQLFLSSYTFNPSKTNTSIFSLARAPSATSTGNALGADAGGSPGLKMGIDFSALYSPTTQDPVDTARVWDRTFWRFLGGFTATGDLAVLLTLLNTGNPTQTQGAAALTAATSGVSAGSKGSFGTWRGGASTKSGITNNVAAAAAATDAAVVSGKSLGTSPHTPKFGTQLLMEALKRSGTYSHLRPPASAFQMLSSSIASVAGTAGGARVADEAAGGRVAAKGERDMMDDEVEQQQHAHRTPLSPEAQNPPLAGSRMNNTCTVLLSLDDFAREEEVRLHRDFWTHIPAILATLTEGVMYSGSHGAAHPHKGSESAPYEAGAGRGEVASLRDHYGSSGCWNSAPHYGATNESGRGDEVLQDLAASAGVAASVAGDGADENVLAALHLPSVEALQLLPTFCPLLHNYTGAVTRLIHSAPEYARSTQAQHARALAVVAAAAAQQQQQQQAALSPNFNDVTGVDGECPAECEHSTTASTSSASAPLSNARVGLTRTAAQRFSVAHMQELKDSHTSLSGSDRRPGGAAVAAAGRTFNANSPAPAEIVEHSLLAAGSRTEVRAVDVVVHALVNAIYVQCVMAVAIQQQARAKATGYAMAGPAPTAAAATSVAADGKTTLFEGGRTLALGSSLNGNGPCARGSSDGSSAAEGGLGTTSGNNNASMVTDEDRVLDKSAANVSLSYTGGGYSLNASFGVAPNTLSHSSPHPPHPMAIRTGGGGVGGTIGSTSNGSYHDPRSHHLPQAHAHHQQPQQLSQLLRNFSFDTTCSPTDAALSLLRMAREGKSNEHGGGEGDRRPDSVGSDGSTTANLGLQPSLGLPTPCTNLHSIELTTQDIVACANDFSWVSLPSVMKAELQHLQEQLRGTSRAAQRMEGQVRGELALLLFRLLSIVLDWLMPAVYVADPRVWLFYRKWCCDLYRVLCTDAALLEEFHRLLNQSDLAVSSTAADVSGLPSRRRGSTRDGHGVSQTKARSVARTPTLSPLQDPPSLPGSGMAQPKPQARLHLPGTPAAVGTAAIDNGDYHDASTVFLALEGTAASTGGAARHRSTSCASPLTDNASVATSASIEDAFSFILPGSSLVVSVSHETPPVQPGVRNLLAQEEADRREALADMALLRAAHALLNDEGTVVPLPCPFLITRLVAATLRGIDADIAESLLWVAGQAPASDPAARAGVGSGVEDAAGDILVDARRSGSVKSCTAQSQRAAAVGTRGLREDGEHCDTSRGGHDHDAEEDEEETVLPGRHLSHAAHRTASGHRLPSHHHSRCVRHHRSISADARVGGSTSPAAASYYTVDSEEDDAGYGDHWYGVLARRERSQLAPSSQPDPATANGPGRGAAASASSIPPHTTPRTPFSDLTSTGGLQRLSLPPQPSEGPTLVHHHRFRYPSVHGYADVAKLYLSTLDDAELVLSSHDPVYASLVLSTADLHLHDLRDTSTAASLVNTYLVDVGEERIQRPVWEELPAVVISDEGGGVAASPLNVAGDAAGGSSSARPAPGRGFSVTRARQGNTQGPTSTTAAPGAAGVAAGSAPLPPQQQQPYVPMVIPSWNNEQEKEEFLVALQLLRQMQAFLAVEQTKLQHNVLET